MAAREYRYELKYEISLASSLLLKQQLKTLMSMDPHSVSEEYSYYIRSLYFDDVNSSAFYEKINGEEFRKKYRIRMYNGNDDHIVLECKYKHENMTYKDSCVINKEVSKIFISGEYGRVLTKNEFLNKFISEAMAKQLRPSVIVDYKRTALTYPTSDVRVTFDSEIRSGRYSSDFFDTELNTLPLLDSQQVVMEVKFNEFLPEHISLILSSIPTLREAISKFALCRNVK